MRELLFVGVMPITELCLIFFFSVCLVMVREIKSIGDVCWMNDGEIIVARVVMDVYGCGMLVSIEVGGDSVCVLNIVIYIGHTIQEV